MHTLQEVRAEYDRLDRLIGIDTRMIELKISKRAVRQLGSFRSPTRGRGPLRITLSALILDDDEQFWDTVSCCTPARSTDTIRPGATCAAVWAAIPNASPRSRGGRRSCGSKRSSTSFAARAAGRRAATSGAAERWT